MTEPRPVSIYPPAISRSLDDWLTTAYPSDAVLADNWTRLGQIAYYRAIELALAACTTCASVPAILAGVVWSLGAGTVLPIVLFGLLAVVLIAVGTLLLRRVSRRLPKSHNPGRQIENPVVGVVVAVVVWAAIAIPLFVGWSDIVMRGMEFVIVGVLLVLATFLPVCFVIPGVIIARARKSLLHAAADPAYRALLEQERLTWHPQYGDQMFGPL